MIVLLLACAPRAVRYQVLGFELPAASEAAAPGLADEVRTALESGRIRSLVYDGASIGPDDVDALPLPARYATVACAGRWSRGAELDVMVPQLDGDPTAATVWHDMNGQLTVAVARTPGAAPRWPIPRHRNATRWMADLADRYALAGVVDSADRTWSLDDLADLEQALSMLEPRERTALQGLTLRRATAGPARHEMAFYDPGARPSRIDFLDAAWQRYGHGFSGPLDSPVRAPVVTALHEFGHAIADWPARQQFVRYHALLDEAREHALADRFDEADLALDEARGVWRRFKQAGRSKPVLRAYRQVRGNQPGPTTIGARQLHESFAEAFALYRADPDALLRVMPEVHAWFEARGHLVELED